MQRKHCHCVQAIGLFLSPTVFKFCTDTLYSSFLCLVLGLELLWVFRCRWVTMTMMSYKVLKCQETFCGALIGISKLFKILQITYNHFQKEPWQEVLYINITSCLLYSSYDCIHIHAKQLNWTCFQTVATGVKFTREHNEFCSICWNKTCFS